MTKAAPRDRAPAEDVLALPCACASIRRASRAVTQFYDAMLREHGIEAPQFALLTFIDGQGESNQAAIGRALGIDKSTLTRNVQRLDEAGWVKVAGAGGSERALTLTASGRRRLAAARRGWSAAQARLRGILGARDWSALFVAADAVTAAAQRARAERA